MKATGTHSVIQCKHIERILWPRADRLYKLTTPINTLKLYIRFSKNQSQFCSQNAAWP